MPRVASDKINIKNYTSQVPSNRSVMRIEECLVKYGADNIVKLYDNKKLIGIAFTVAINNQKISFRLPARIDRVEKHILKSKTRSASSVKAIEQAERTAWRLLSEFVEIQMSLIHLDQMEFMEVFMPYIYDHSKGETLFEKIKSNGYNLIESKL